MSSIANTKPSKEKVKLMKMKYPRGTELEILEIKDPYINLPVGLTVKVLYVDDKGRIYISYSEDDSSKGRVLTLNDEDMVIKKSK